MMIVVTTGAGRASRKASGATGVAGRTADLLMVGMVERELPSRSVERTDLDVHRTTHHPRLAPPVIPRMAAHASGSDALGMMTRTAFLKLLHADCTVRLRARVAVATLHPLVGRVPENDTLRDDEGDLPARRLRTRPPLSPPAMAGHAVGPTTHDADVMGVVTPRALLENAFAEPAMIRREGFGAGVTVTGGAALRRILELRLLPHVVAG
jgi:hypothetical protein